MSAFALTLHIEKSTEICIIKEQMTRTGHGWMKDQHRHTHTNKVTNTRTLSLANKMPQRKARSETRKLVALHVLVLKLQQCCMHGICCAMCCDRREGTGV